MHIILLYHMSDLGVSDVARASKDRRSGSHRCRTAHNLLSYKVNYRVWNKEEKLLNLHRQSVSNSEATKRLYTDRSTSKCNTKSWETKKLR